MAALRGKDATSGSPLQPGSELSTSNGRDFSTLLLLAAGTMTDTNGATNFTQQFAINGQRGVEATFATDGADIDDPERGGSIMPIFNVDAIQDLQTYSGWMLPREYPDWVWFWRDRQNDRRIEANSVFF
jgi:hypothetical protein